MQKTKHMPLITTRSFRLHPLLLASFIISFIMNVPGIYGQDKPVYPPVSETHAFLNMTCKEAHGIKIYWNKKWSTEVKQSDAYSIAEIEGNKNVITFHEPVSHGKAINIITNRISQVSSRPHWSWLDENGNNLMWTDNCWQETDHLSIENNTPFSDVHIILKNNSLSRFNLDATVHTEPELKPTITRLEEYVKDHPTLDLQSSARFESDNIFKEFQVLDLEFEPFKVVEETGHTINISFLDARGEKQKVPVVGYFWSLDDLPILNEDEGISLLNDTLFDNTLIVRFEETPVFKGDQTRIYINASGFDPNIKKRIEFTKVGSSFSVPTLEASIPFYGSDTTFSLEATGVEPGTDTVLVDVFDEQAAFIQAKTGCEVIVNIIKRQSLPDMKIAPFLEANWRESLKKRYEAKAKDLDEKGKHKEAAQLREKNPPAFQVYKKKIAESIEIDKEYDFYIDHIGVTAIVDGPATYGSALPIAIQQIGGRNWYTGDPREQEIPLEIKKLRGSKEIKLGCESDNCKFIGVMATFIGLKGNASITNLTEQGASDEEFQIMHNIVDKIPDLGILKFAADKIANLKADVEAEVKAEIQVNSKSYAIDDKVWINARARFSKDENADVNEKYTTVGNTNDRNGNKIEGGDVEFSSGISENNPTSINFSSILENLYAKALGIGAAEAQIHSAYGYVYIFNCIDEDGQQKWQHGIEGATIGDTVLQNSIDQAKENILKKLKNIKGPSNREEAENIRTKLEAWLREEIEGIFLNG